MDAPHEPLPSLRKQVRDLDEQLFVLMAKRQELARKIGAVKHAEKLPVKDYGVEKEVIERARARGRELGLYDGMSVEAAELLIKYAVQIQDDTRQRTDHLARATRQRVLLVGGAGRMGRWLSEYFDSFGHAVTLFDPNAGAGTGYPHAASLAQGAAAADIIVLAAPILATAGLLDELVRCGTKALIFDICSLKTPFAPAIKAARTAGLSVTSVHPMFGPDARVLSGRNIIICDCGDATLTARTRELFAGTTASLVTMPLERHDELMSYVLGLSHLTSLVFADVLRGSGIPYEELRTVSSTTFNAQLQVTLPVVHENQDLYFEIQAANRCTGALIEAAQKSLTAYGDAVARDDRKRFRERMTAGRDYLSAALPGAGGKGQTGEAL